MASTRPKKPASTPQDAPVAVVYVGAVDRVEIGDTSLVAQRGEPISVPATLALRLLEQDVWQPDPTLTHESE